MFFQYVHVTVCTIFVSHHIIDTVHHIAFFDGFYKEINFSKYCGTVFYLYTYLCPCMS